MKTLFHAMEQSALDKFIADKSDIMKIAASMSTADRNAARVEMRESAELNDIVPLEIGDKAYRLEGKEAVILVTGRLVAEPGVCDGVFDSVTTYRFISWAAQLAEEDVEVESIRFIFSTPGGSTTGLDETAMVLASLTKPTVGEVHGMCASAGYWLASQLGSIEATAPTAFIGSIGVVAELVDRSEAEGAQGIKRYTITSTDAPDKRPDITTEKGRDKYTARLDDLHGIFARRVAEGRGVTEKVVNADFGKGDVLIAEDAMKAGMIDRVKNTRGTASVSHSLTPAAVAGETSKEDQQMTLQELLSKDPAAKAEFDLSMAGAKAEGQKDGVASMQATIKRVSPFLANAEYPEIIGKTAISVLNGEAQVIELTSAVAAVDAVRQDALSKTAADATADLPETKGEGQPPVKKEANLIASAEDLESAITAAKEG